MMLLVHKDISHMPIMELENNSESVWVKVASWYRQPGGTSEDFQLFRDQLDHIRNQHKGKKLPLVHVLGDFNFRDIDLSDRLNKSGSALSQSEGHHEQSWFGTTGTLPYSRKKYIGFITHFSSCSVSGYSLTGQTKRP